MAGYTDDLAFIHDAGFGDLARHAAGVLQNALRAHGFRTGLIVDLGCGSGILSKAMIDAGYDVLGIDISPAMIRIARKRVPRARFATASLLRFEFPACHAVVAIGECVNYRFDENSSRQALARLFRRVYDALSPGGIFLFDFAEPGQPGGETRSQKHVLAPDWAVLVDTAENTRERLLVRHIVSFRQRGKLFRRTEETHKVRLYAAAELITELRWIGFRARVCRRYGTLRLRAAHAAIIATK